MLKALFAGMAVLIGLTAFMVAYFAGAPTVVNLNEDVRTDPKTAAGLTCATAVGASTCAVTLPSVHEYADTSFTTITETAPGTGTRTGSISDNGVTVTVSGLNASTSYTFSIVYQERGADVSDGMNDILLQTPVLLGLALLVATMLGVAGVIMSFGRGHV